MSPKALTPLFGRHLVDLGRIGTKQKGAVLSDGPWGDGYSALVEGLYSGEGLGIVHLHSGQEGPGMIEILHTQGLCDLVAGMEQLREAQILADPLQGMGCTEGLLIVFGL